MTNRWLHLRRGGMPVILAIPHAGTRIPESVERALLSPWLARKDTDWWARRLYEFAYERDITILATEMSRTVIDANRDPEGTSLYPGQETTGLCPLTTFDGEALYKAGREPDLAEIGERRRCYFDPYHDTLAGEIDRLRRQWGVVLLYDAHTIRSKIPRLFKGTLPHFNIGTDNGRTCAPELAASLEAICTASGLTTVVNGRFRGGWTTRHYANPPAGIHTLQIELACRAYMDEPAGGPKPENWPTGFDTRRAAKARRTLSELLDACLRFTNLQEQSPP
jgi:N-formylglutamate deformylase